MWALVGQRLPPATYLLLNPRHGARQQGVVGKSGVSNGAAYILCKPCLSGPPAGSPGSCVTVVLTVAQVVGA